MRTERIVLSEKRNVTLTAFINPVGGEFPNIPKRPGVLVLPGGGYQMCSDREAEPVALAYAQRGFHAFVLRYSVKEHAYWPRPLEDYEEAMELIKSKEEEWKLYPDKIAVVGFSAGGHLAGAAATMARNKPRAAILGYPALKRSLIKMCVSNAPDIVDAVDMNTCPCFVFSTRNDDTVPIENSVDFLSALTEKGVMFESHIYSHGPHGFSTGTSDVTAPGTVMAKRCKSWVSDSIDWLFDIMGDFGSGELLSPECPSRTDANNEPFLSAGCTLSYLLSKESAAKLLRPLLPEDGTYEDMSKYMTLERAMRHLGMDKEKLAELDSELRKISDC